MVYEENEHNRRLRVEKIRRQINKLHDRRVRQYAMAANEIGVLQATLERMGEPPEDLNKPDFDDPSLILTYAFQGLDT